MNHQEKIFLLCNRHQRIVDLQTNCVSIDLPVKRSDPACIHLHTYCFLWNRWEVAPRCGSHFGSCMTWLTWGLCQPAGLSKSLFERNWGRSSAAIDCARPFCKRCPSLHRGGTVCLPGWGSLAGLASALSDVSRDVSCFQRWRLASSFWEVSCRRWKVRTDLWAGLLVWENYHLGSFMS